VKSVSQKFFTDCTFAHQIIAENWQLKFKICGRYFLIEFFKLDSAHDVVLIARIGGNVPERNIGELLAEARLFGFGQASRIDGECSAEVFVVHDDVDAVAGRSAAVVACIARAVARRGGRIVADVVFAGDVDFLVDFGAVNSDGVVFGLAVFADQGRNRERVFLWLVNDCRSIGDHAGDRVIRRLRWSGFGHVQVVLAHRSDELLLPGGLLLLLLLLELVLLLQLHLSNVVVHRWIVRRLRCSLHLSHFKDGFQRGSVGEICWGNWVLWIRAGWGTRGAGEATAGGGEHVGSARGSVDFGRSFSVNLTLVAAERVDVAELFQADSALVWFLASVDSHMNSQ